MINLNLLKISNQLWFGMILQSRILNTSGILVVRLQLIGACNRLSDEILESKIHDPSNFNNIILNDLSIEQKHRIKKLAEDALDAKYWHFFFYNLTKKVIFVLILI